MVQQTDILGDTRDDMSKPEMLGQVIHALGILDASIDELASLLRKGYIIEEKKEELEALLEQRKESRMYLRKSLLLLGGLDYMIPYWRM